MLGAVFGFDAERHPLVAGIGLRKIGDTLGVIKRRARGKRKGFSHSDSISIAKRRPAASFCTWEILRRQKRLRGIAVGRRPQHPGVEARVISRLYLRAHLRRAIVAAV